MDLLIKNAKVITPYEILKHHSIIVENGKIKDIVEDGENEQNFSKVIDVEGNYVSPGFIDIHNHGNFGHDCMDSSFEALDSMAKFHVKNGVTSFLATTMTASTQEIEKAIKNVALYMQKKNNKNTRILGIYLEGPYFSLEKKGAQPPEHIKNPDINELENFIKISNNNIKVVSLAPELPNALETINYLKSQHVTVALGHTNSVYKDAVKAIQRGAIQATHLFNGMRGFTHREPGVVGAVLTDERVKCEIICDGIHIHPAAVKMAVRMKGVDKIILISDAMMAAGLKDGEYMLGGQKVFVKQGVAMLEDGTLAGSTLTLNKAVYNMVQLADVALHDAVRMAALNPAEAIGVAAIKGSIEIGKDADLVVFDDDIKISKTLINGEICWDHQTQ